MELLHVTTKEKWVLKTQIFKTFTSFEALPPWISKCQAVKHTKCTLHFFTIYKQIEQPTGGGGISSSKEKGGPKGKIKPKKGEISFSKENGSQRQRQMCTKNEKYVTFRNFSIQKWKECPPT